MGTRYRVKNKKGFLAINEVALNTAAIAAGMACFEESLFLFLFLLSLL